ncbi:hypothetical protein RvY_05690 [Ramazzottius varieornatus]|uniref:Uncharacterized protein n=1 Tax=Ramazzottius varieornatus TaxID=947166 RepID=A0A1D1V2J3_RAMVA|nr:hypothetical protein RvY_05690 [Ramazzottius varieornatus]
MDNKGQITLSNEARVHQLNMDSGDSVKSLGACVRD